MDATSLCAVGSSKMSKSGLCTSVAMSPILRFIPVDIPLSETELGGPFNKLRSLFEPLAGLLAGLPDSNQELIDRIMGRTPDTVEPVAVEPSP